MFEELYDEKFFQKSIRPDRQPSYKAIAEFIWSQFHPNSVVDYGCGCGWVLKYLKDLGVQTILGLERSQDAAKVQEDSRLKRFIEFGNSADLSRPLVYPRRSKIFKSQENRGFDIAICIEVAEHIPHDYADILIENITFNTNLLVFSAASPGQGGVGHVNEQPFYYWEKLFKRVNFQLCSAETKRFQRYLIKAKAKSWYSNNIQVWKRED